MSWEERFEKNPRRTPFNIGASIILVFAGIGLVGMAVSILTAPARSVTGIVNRTLDSENVIANYEWFKRQNQDVKAIDARLDASRNAVKSFEASAGPRTTWTFEDKQESNRLNSIVLGLEGQRASMVAEYNARTQMMNRDLFRTSDLPAELH